MGDLPLDRFLADLALAVGPGLAWVLWFYRRDLYEPEPVRLVLMAFVWGLLLVPVAAVLEHGVRVSLSVSTGPALDLDLLAYLAFVAIVEEGLKVAILAVRFYPSVEFNEPMDGIVYGASVGMGFATLENALYMVRSGPEVLWMRAGITGLIHAGCGALSGYALGRAKFARRALGHLARGLVAAIGIHWAWNVAAAAATRSLGPWGLALLTVALLGVLALAGWLLDRRIDEAQKSSPFRPRRRRTGSRQGSVPPPSGST